MKRLVLFDIDGTLITGKHGHQKAFSDAFKKVCGANIEVFWEGSQGMTDQQIITKSLKEYGLEEKVIKERMSRCMKEMGDSFKKSISKSNVRPFGGVISLLEELKSRGEILGLVTGNILPIARGKLERAGIWSYFSAWGMGNDDINRTRLVKLAIKRARDKFNLLFNKVVLVGDTPKDIQAGIEADVCTIGVATGIYSEEELERAGANFVVDSLKDTRKILEIITKNTANQK